MTKQESPQDFFAEEPKAGGLNIDFKRVVYRATRYWYIICLSVVLALVVAFLRNRYATRIYSVTASMIIKEAGDISGAELLYNNPLVSYNRNYLNELYIIKSYPLIQSVLDELNFGVAFYREGNFLTTEAYDYVPVEAYVLSNPPAPVNFSFAILSGKKFQLKAKSEPAKEFAFGDTIQFNGLQLLFTSKSREKIDDYINEPFIFSYTPVSFLTSSYVTKLKASWAEAGAGVINLTISGANVKKNKDFLEGLIKNFQEYDLQKKNQTASMTVSFITEQLDGISDSLQHVEQQLERFKNRNVVTDLTGEALRLYQKLEGLETQKTTLVISRNYYKYLIDYIQKSENMDQIILPSSIGITDPILTGLVSNMIDKQMEIKMLTRKGENPLVNDARSGISEIKKDIIESVENQRATDKIKEDYLNKQIKDVERQLGHLPLAERRLVSIQRNYTLLENLYIFLLQKRSEAAISQASNTSDIVVVNPPMQLGGLITPKVRQNYIIALVLGISLPVLLFFLMEVFNTRVQSREDIERLTSIPFIGGVGHKRTENNLEVLSHPKTAIAESFRALRSNLSYFLGKKDKAVFLITSSISGEGKTFTSVNLASVFSLSGKKTLIVGADMRKPKLFNDFNLSNDTGLSAYLASISEFDSIVQKTAFPDLDLISGGPVPPNPSELLLTARMDEFIVEAKKRYDYIIIDTPPLAIVTDAFVLTRFADHTIFLVRQNYTPKALLKTAQDFFVSGKLRDTSLLLNDIYKSGPGYGYGYEYGYGFGYSYNRKTNGDGYYSG